MNDRLDALRKRIEHEDGLISQRLSWLVASQSFLVSGFALTLNGSTSTSQYAPRVAHVRDVLLELIPWTAIASTLAVGLTLAGGIWSMARIRAAADKIKTPDDSPIYNRATIRRMGLVAPIVVPIIFLALWVTLLIAAR